MESSTVLQPRWRCRHLSCHLRVRWNDGDWLSNRHSSRACKCDRKTWWTERVPTRWSWGKTWKKTWRRPGSEFGCDWRGYARFDWMANKILVADSASAGHSRRHYCTSLKGANRGTRKRWRCTRRMKRSMGRQSVSCRLTMTRSMWDLALRACC